MKIVIDIPDEWRVRIEYNRRPNTIECGELVESIWKGEMLPKGHGRLIDADDVKKNHEKWIGYLDEDMIARLNIAIDNHVKTIIEAESEEEG